MKLNVVSGIFFVLLACNHASKKNDRTEKQVWIYQLTSPDKKLTLEDELEEISDITILENGNIVCVQDEEGKLFEIDSETGKVVSTKTFAEKGDFEALAISGKNAYAVTSDGIVYELLDFEKEKKNITAYPTFLDEGNNVEGACFNPHTGNILLICKDSPGASLDRREYKAVYEFNVATHQVSSQPFFTIPVEKIKKAAEKSGATKKGFNPSGIAVHPLNKHYFVIASNGKKIVELDEKFQIVHVAALPEATFIQPEGISFDKEGGMYISNEGKGGEATILYFAMNP